VVISKIALRIVRRKRALLPCDGPVVQQRGLKAPHGPAQPRRYCAPRPWLKKVRRMRNRVRSINLFFALLSVAYASAIFVLAGSPLAFSLSAFNPRSILHIPLYGILTFLLFFSIPASPNAAVASVDAEEDCKNQSIPVDKQKTMRNAKTLEAERLKPSEYWRHLAAGLLAFGVAIADEIHQSHVPGREASLSDVVLDGLGIVLACGVIMWLRKRKVSWLESW